jgi:hypothetical protein
MKKLKILFLLIAVAIISCKSEKSLESYFIANEDNKDILIVDVPVNMFKNTEELSKEEQAAIKRVKKLNVLALQKDVNNKKEFEKQKNIILEILKNDKYQTLSKIKIGKTKLNIKFIGNDTAIDEIVLFATDNDKGFLLARILGDKMNPDDMQLIIKNIKNLDLNEINKLNGIFK